MINKETYTLLGSKDCSSWHPIAESEVSYLTMEMLLEHPKYEFFRLVSNVTKEILVEAKIPERINAKRP